MKLIILFVIVFTGSKSFGQTVPQPATHNDARLIYFEDFNSPSGKWIVETNKKRSSRIDSGFYYLTASGRAYGEAQEVKFDSSKDFEIETRIKIVSGSPQHKNYYSMIFWGREAMHGYYLSFAKDSVVSVEICHGKNQDSCAVKSGSLQKSSLNPKDFNVFMIRKKANTYFFLINGKEFFQMPFAPFFGNLVGVGAGRNTTLAID